MEKGTFLQFIETRIYANRKLASFLLFGLLFLGVGLFLFRSGVLDSTEVKVLGDEQSNNLSANPSTLPSTKTTAEIAGSVLKPGVYQLETGARVDELLIMAGGLSSNADRDWVAKNLNRAAKVVDGQKIYVPKRGETTVYGLQSTVQSSTTVVGSQSTVDGKLNLNTASSKELDALPGIGETRVNAIISGRPYSSPEELLTRKILPKSVYEKVKGSVTAP